MALNLADGQLAAISATILAAGTNERIVSATFANTVAREQEIFLFLTRSGGTARQIFHGKLKEDETLYLHGLALDTSDVVSGYASGASSVDYVITHTPNAQFSVLIRGADGSPKQSAEIEINTTEKFGLTQGEVKIVGLLEEMRDALLNIA